jgi:nucleoside-diphosphate-sugar epimerase
MNELRKTDLEWTTFHNGFFLDCYAIPHIDSYMAPAAFVIDIPNKVAAIPGSGNDPVYLTYTRDLAKFAVAALDRPKWDEMTFCYSDSTTWNDFVALLEDATGTCCPSLAQALS